MSVAVQVAVRRKRWAGGQQQWLAAVILTRIHRIRRDERGDVPGWVLVTLMTAGLSVALWGVAGERLLQMFNDAMDNVAGGP